MVSDERAAHLDTVLTAFNLAPERLGSGLARSGGWLPDSYVRFLLTRLASNGRICLPLKLELVEHTLHHCADQVDTRSVSPALEVRGITVMGLKTLITRVLIVPAAGVRRCDIIRCALQHRRNRPSGTTCV